VYHGADFFQLVAGEFLMAHGSKQHWWLGKALLVGFTTMVCWQQAQAWEGEPAAVSTTTALPVTTPDASLRTSTDLVVSAGVDAVLSKVASQPVLQEFTGSFQAVLHSALSSAEAGLVHQVLVDAGDQVREGQLLARLDSRRAQAMLAEQQASLAQAEAELSEQHRLVDEAVKIVQGASLPATELRRRQAELAKAKAQLANAKARVSQAQISLSQHQIHAPFAGVISRRLVMPGQWRQPGEPLFELVSLEQLWLDVEVPQQFYQQLAAQQTAQVLPDQQSGVQFNLPISARIPVGQPNSRAFRLRFLHQNSAGASAILPGTSARVRFAVEEQKLSSVPASALLRQPDGAYAVWRLPADAKVGARSAVSRQAVELVQQQGERVLLKGLPAYVPVLISGHQQLMSGSVVQLQQLLTE